MFGDKSVRFDLVSQSKNTPKAEPQDLDPSAIEKATKTVLREMTDVRGTSQEIETQNTLLMRCAMGDKHAQLNVKALIRKILIDNDLAQQSQLDTLVKKIYEDNYGLGAIDDLFNDSTINEVWVNGYEHIWIEKGGRKYRLEDRQFKDDADIIRIIRLMLQFDRKDITAMEPMRESRMLDGSRLTVLIPPVAKRPYINIRKFDAFDLSTESLLNAGTITTDMADWMSKAIRGRANVLIIGETGSGKTSFLKWMISCMDPKLRLGTIETNFELKLDEKYPERNVFSYEEHPEIGVTMGELFKKCLRSSPDIIICGEARGAEADELIRAMRRGHPGSVGTMHTNSPETAIDDLAEMINEDGRRRDPVQLRYRIASALDLIVQVRRFEDTGKRRVTRITEVITTSDSYDYSLNDIFRYEVDPHDPSKGGFMKAGCITEAFKHKLNSFGLPYDVVSQM